MSAPLLAPPDGLPIGVQAIGRLGEEALFLSVAASLKLARPWVHRRPSLAEAG